MTAANHYETLGVERTASADDIKQAYRRQAKTAHPDRGGDSSLMAALNRAYAVLGDAERRAQYDANGDDGSGPTIDDEARTVLVQFFTAAFDSPHQNAVEAVSAMIAENRSQIRMGLGQLKDQRARWAKRTGKVRVKGDALNLAQMVIDQKMRGIDEAQAKLEQNQRIIERVAEMAKAYVGDEPKTQARARVLNGGGTMYTSAW